ncbi:hypothetical protein B0J11DRAFT_616182 [Dendryphion nanum]|uniref:J domain-containing protein n=1 Tax=Dendryphion nanum TaxID=256645 RepID=A0A9P9DQN4_9PLEO|nr:hypothetical protein B0J11DRAFT_616182 [Dendryphion nanum]
MSIQTYYTTLGVVPAAPSQVIRAAYKAQVLIHHPDKTIHLTAVQRAQHAASFRNIQEAYDVLSSPAQRTAYDIKLEQYWNKENTKRFSRQRYYNSTVQTTSVTERANRKAQIAAELAQLREQRERQDKEDAKLSLSDLKLTLKLWTDLSEDPKHSPPERAHCHIKMFEYEQRLRRREQEHNGYRDSSHENPQYQTRIPQPSSNASISYSEITHTNSNISHTSLFRPERLERARNIRTCTKCGMAHANFPEWKKYNTHSANAAKEENSYFRTV